MEKIVRLVNSVDRVYEHLLSKIMNFGQLKETRSGRVKSIFGEQLKFDLKEGLPIITTKKLYTKGIIHELLWFLQRPYNSHGSSNIEYLVKNNVHIWDDDAYRWFKEWVTKEVVSKGEGFWFLTAVSDDEIGEEPKFEPWVKNNEKRGNLTYLLNITKDEFIDLTLQRVELRVKQRNCKGERVYRFGDLGPIYGKQWRDFDGKNKTVDQIKNIIGTLKTNPNDRRMVCLAYNPSVLKEVALPPCHMMMQFYTRKLSINERWELYKNRGGDAEIYDKAINPWTPRQEKTTLNEELDIKRIPIYGLSCMYTCRSQDCFLGTPFNIASYAILTHMIAKLVNMAPDTLVASMGDCHIYEAHFDAVNEQLSRKGSDTLPKLVINGAQKNIEDFKYEDFKIIGYNPDPPIKAPLLVGM